MTGDERAPGAATPGHDVATEDLVVDDLNGDGWPDIVACGRATFNVKLYINKGKP